LREAFRGGSRAEIKLDAGMALPFGTKGKDQGQEEKGSKTRVVPGVHADRRKRKTNGPDTAYGHSPQPGREITD